MIKQFSAYIIKQVFAQGLYVSFRYHFLASCTRGHNFGAFINHDRAEMEMPYKRSRVKFGIRVHLTNLELPWCWATWAAIEFRPDTLTILSPISNPVTFGLGLICYRHISLRRCLASVPRAIINLHLRVTFICVESQSLISPLVLNFISTIEQDKTNNVLRKYKTQHQCVKMKY